MLRPNPPRMVTVVIAVVLVLGGLGLYFLEQSVVRDVLSSLPFPDDISRTLLRLSREDTTAFTLLAAGPLLLVIGSLLPGI